MLNWDSSQLIFGYKFRSISNGSDIIYADTHNAQDALMSCPKDRPFTLITHNSDKKVVIENNSFCGVKIPNNLKAWFSQNVCSQDPRLISLPIGLENPEWYPEHKKSSKIISKNHQPKSIRNLVYVNHSISTNPAERLQPYQILEGKSFATVVRGKNGDNFDRYLDDVYNHRFVVCPEGNGTDTHRTWECLYLGTIPIEKRNINNSFHSDLPIVFVDSWDQITEEFLMYELTRILKRQFNFSKLTFGYWKKTISEKHLRS